MPISNAGTAILAVGKTALASSNAAAYWMSWNSTQGIIQPVKYSPTAGTAHRPLAPRP